MNESDRLKAIVRLNREPINQIAMKLLPPGWEDPSCLHLLSLAQWRAEELDLADVREQISLLAAAAPAVAMKWAQETREGDDILDAEDLEGLSREEAGDRILENLEGRMQTSNSPLLDSASAS